jgi:hypothetical protein
MIYSKLVVARYYTLCPLFTGFFVININRTLIVLLVILGLLSWRAWSDRDIVHPPGQLVKQLPMQTQSKRPDGWSVGEFHLLPKASLEIRARVLSRERYYWGSQADLSPLDLALGWGAMSDQAVLDRIEVTQGNRWYFTRYQHPAPLSDTDIIYQSGNMHMIPAEDWIEDELKTLRSGDIVNLSGYLVDVESESGFRWKTSLNRTDTGNGSCEVFYIESVRREARPDW